ncbi:MAG: DsbA family protein [Alphaproteobacteria bacterium]
MNKWLMYGLVAVAVVLVVVVAYVVMGDSSGPAGSSGTVSVEIRPTDRVRGNPNAPITIVEYASFTCSHCAKFEREVMPHLVREYVDTGKARLVYRDFPLDGAARLASALALCVPEDKYYSFVDLLLVNQRTWLADRNSDQRITAEEVFEGLVQMGRFAGFNREKVESCINDQSTLAHIDQTQADAQTRYAINGTPTFIINGEVVRRAVEWEDLDKQLKDILAKK